MAHGVSAELERVYDQWIDSHPHLLDYGIFELAEVPSVVSIAAKIAQGRSLEVRRRGNSLLLFDRERCVATTPSSSIVDAHYSTCETLTSPILLSEILQGVGVPYAPVSSVFRLNDKGGPREGHSIPAILWSSKTRSMTRTTLVSEHGTPGSGAGGADPGIQHGEWGIVQNYSLGIDIRVIVSGGKAISTIGLVPPRVEGNGESHLGNRIDALRKIRRRNRFLFPGDIWVDFATLYEKGLSLDYLPARGEHVWLSLDSRSKGGGVPVVVDELTGSWLPRIAVSAVEALPGIGVAEVLLRYQPELQEAVIVRVEPNPNILMHGLATRSQSDANGRLEMIISGLLDELLMGR